MKDRVTTIHTALMEIDTIIENLTKDEKFLYEEDNSNCIPGLEKARDVIGEYVFNMYKEVV